MGNSISSFWGKSATTPVNQIQETISDNCVVIFSKTSCSYCSMAKKIFHDMNVNYKVVELDMLEYGNQFQDALHKMTGDRTVPRIFVNGRFIGGAADTHRLHKEGKLLPLVHQCYLNKGWRKDVEYVPRIEPFPFHIIRHIKYVECDEVYRWRQTANDVMVRKQKFSIRCLPDGARKSSLDAGALTSPSQVLYEEER
ncbi:Glutaredoxin-2, mitochondrial [Apodemus speciosus]|uniref:Glutaredoxin-2, mitochondrial n=1 Tax=Apodemus speciosus TaxID=105296 RepID=A0ABQ0EEP3_APOSI